MIDLCTLGTGGAIPLPERALSSLYVRVNGRGMLIDCGEGTQTQLRRLGWGFRCVEAVLITHYHADHCSGLPGFLLSMAKTGRTEVLELWGPPGLQHLMDAVRVFCPQLPFPLALHELPLEPTPFRVLGMEAVSFPLSHSVPCLGFRFSLARTAPFMPELARSLEVPLPMWKLLKCGHPVTLESGRTVMPEQVTGKPRTGLSFLYATDTRPVDEIVRQGRGTDLMILEGMYGEEEKRPQALRNRHMLFREAARLASEAGTKKLLLTHFSNCIEDPALFLEEARSVFPATDAAEDLLQTTLHYPTED